MNQAVVDKLARAMLYEGYVLYPYRPSVKNSHRWTFGGIYPRSWSDAQAGTDACIMQTQCLVNGTDRARVRIIIRFLHLLDRRVGELLTPLTEMPPNGAPPFRSVPSLQIGTRNYQSWQEAEEREVDPGEFQLADLISRPARVSFEFPSRQMFEPLTNDAGAIVGILIRQQQAIQGSVELCVSSLADGLFQISVRITNETNLNDTGNRDIALMHSFASTHTIMGVEDGEFVSLTDQPEALKAHAAACRNIGAWPVLVGDGTQRDTILSSPIILYDYPQLAPESPGDLFDSTEIDEILTLRILTLTDEEKSAAAGVDHRVRDLLSRTESLARDQLANLHGTMRGMRPVTLEPQHGQPQHG
jgi:hypothetical protein